MRRNEVDRGPGQPAAAVEDFRRCTESWRKRMGRCLLTPEVAHRVAELVVPLRRDPADLVSPGPAIPSLGDQLHRADYRILAHRFEKSTLLVEAGMLPRK